MFFFYLFLGRMCLRGCCIRNLNPWHKTLHILLLELSLSELCWTSCLRSKIFEVRTL